MKNPIALALALVIGPMSSTFARQWGFIQHPTKKSIHRTQPARGSDLSSKAIRTELKARGFDPSSASTPSALRDDFTEYDFQARGSGLNPNKKAFLEAAKNLSISLSETSLQSHVTVRTQRSGARVWYRLIGRDISLPFNQITNNTEGEDLSIGLYYVWAERDGKATSSKEIIFRIIQTKVPIDLVEVTQ